MAAPVDIEWSLDALADLDRFAAFLHERFPDLAGHVGRELIERSEVLCRHPKLGRAIAGREEYREMLLDVLGGTYVLQYLDRIVEFPVDRTRLFEIGAPLARIPANVLTISGYDRSLDGSQFLVPIPPPGAAAAARLLVIENWRPQH